MMYSELNIKCLETYGFAEAELLSRKTKIKTYRRSLLRGKSNALSKKPFEKWHRQSLIRVNPCKFVVDSLCRSLSAEALAKADVFVAKIRVNPRNPRLKYYQSIMTFYAKQTQFYEKSRERKL